MFYGKPKMGHLEICSNTLYKEERKNMYCVMHSTGYFLLTRFNSSKDTEVGINIPNLHRRKFEDKRS